jgi:hypothetical protein
MLFQLRRIFIKEGNGNMAMNSKQSGFERRQYGVFRSCVLVVGSEGLRKVMETPV